MFTLYVQIKTFISLENIVCNVRLWVYGSLEEENYARSALTDEAIYIIYEERSGGTVQP